MSRHQSDSDRAIRECTFYLFDRATGEFVTAYHAVMSIFDWGSEERAHGFFDGRGRAAALSAARSLADLATRMTGRKVGIADRSAPSGQMFAVE